jgi:hypothetical protein
MYQASLPINYIPDPLVIHSFNWQTMGGEIVVAGGGLSSNAWPTANKAIFVPFSIGKQHTYQNMFWMNGAGILGNVDVGIYDATGTKLVSTGSKAQTGVSSAQIFALTGGFTLNAGSYWLAMSMSSTGTQISNFTSFSNVRTAGQRVLTTAFPLPASASSWIGSDTSFTPFIALSELTSP